VRPNCFGFKVTSQEYKHSCIQPKATEFSYSSNSLLARNRSLKDFHALIIYSLNTNSVMSGKRKAKIAFSPLEKGEQFRTSEELVGDDWLQRTILLEAALLLSQIKGDLIFHVKWSNKNIDSRLKHSGMTKIKRRDPETSSGWRMRERPFVLSRSLSWACRRVEVWTVLASLLAGLRSWKESYIGGHCPQKGSARNLVLLRTDSWRSRGGMGLCRYLCCNACSVYQGFTALMSAAREFG